MEIMTLITLIITDFTMIVTITDGVSLTSASLVVPGTRTVVTLVMMVVHCLSLSVSASPGHKSYCTVVYMWTGGNLCEPDLEILMKVFQFSFV